MGTIEELHSGDQVVWAVELDGREKAMAVSLRSQHGRGPFQVCALARGAECVHVSLKGSDGVLKDPNNAIKMIHQKYVTKI